MTGRNMTPSTQLRTPAWLSRDTQGASHGLRHMGAPTATKLTAPFLYSKFYVSVRARKNWRIWPLKVRKCGRCQLYHSLAVGPSAGHAPYLGCGFSICATRKLESMS